MTQFSVTTRPREWVRTLFVIILLIVTHAAFVLWVLWFVVWGSSRGVKVWFRSTGKVTWWQES